MTTPSPVRDLANLISNVEVATATCPIPPNPDGASFASAMSEAMDQTPGAPVLFSAPAKQGVAPRLDQGSRDPAAATTPRANKPLGTPTERSAPAQPAESHGSLPGLRPPGNPQQTEEALLCPQTSAPEEGMADPVDALLAEETSAEPNVTFEPVLPLPFPTTVVTPRDPATTRAAQVVEPPETDEADNEVRPSECCDLEPVDENGLQPLDQAQVVEPPETDEAGNDIRPSECCDLEPVDENGPQPLDPATGEGAAIQPETDANRGLARARNRAAGHASPHSRLNAETREPASTPRGVAHAYGRAKATDANQEGVDNSSGSPKSAQTPGVSRRPVSDTNVEIASSDLMSAAGKEQSNELAMPRATATTAQPLPDDHGANATATATNLRLEDALVPAQTPWPNANAAANPNFPSSPGLPQPSRPMSAPGDLKPPREQAQPLSSMAQPVTLAADNRAATNPAEVPGSVDTTAANRTAQPLVAPETTPAETAAPAPESADSLDAEAERAPLSVKIQDHAEPPSQRDVPPESSGSRPSGHQDARAHRDSPETATPQPEASSTTRATPGEAVVASPAGASIRILASSSPNVRSANPLAAERPIHRQNGNGAVAPATSPTVSSADTGVANESGSKSTNTVRKEPRSTSAPTLKTVQPRGEPTQPRSAFPFAAPTSQRGNGSTVPLTVASSADWRITALGGDPSMASTLPLSRTPLARARLEGNTPPTLIDPSVPANVSPRPASLESTRTPQAPVAETASMSATTSTVLGASVPASQLTPLVRLRTNPTAVASEGTTADPSADSRPDASGSARQPSPSSAADPRQRRGGTASEVTTSTPPALTRPVSASASGTTNSAVVAAPIFTVEADETMEPETESSRLANVASSSVTKATAEGRPRMPARGNGSSRIPVSPRTGAAQDFSTTPLQPSAPSAVRAAAGEVVQGQAPAAASLASQASADRGADRSRSDSRRWFGSLPARTTTSRASTEAAPLNDESYVSRPFLVSERNAWATLRTPALSGLEGRSVQTSSLPKTEAADSGPPRISDARLAPPSAETAARPTLEVGTGLQAGSPNLSANSTPSKATPQDLPKHPVTLPATGNSPTALVPGSESTPPARQPQAVEIGSLSQMTAMQPPSTPASVDTESEELAGMDPVTPGKTVGRAAGAGASVPDRQKGEHGITAAPRDADMKKGLKQNEFARPGQQELPKIGPERLEGTQPDSDSTDSSRSMLTEASSRVLLWSPKSGELDSDALDTLSLSPAAGSKATASEHVLLEVSRHAVQLKELRAESLAVVLKPDDRTEIFLHLTQREGMIEVNARFERGDLQSLSSHWGQMQQALLPQGIRLGQLQESRWTGTEPNSFVPGGQTGAQGEGTANRNHRSTPDSLDQLPLVGSLTEPLRQGSARRVARSSALLESWA